MSDRQRLKIESKVIVLLHETLARPEMWACTCEALVARCSALLDVLGCDGRDLYQVLPREGPVVLNPGAPLDAKTIGAVMERVGRLLRDRNPTVSQEDE